MNRIIIRLARVQTYVPKFYFNSKLDEKGKGDEHQYFTK